MTNALLCSRQLLAFLFVFVATLNLQQLAVADETLYISFDSTINGLNKNGVVTPTNTIGKISFAAGKKGQAFLAGPTQGTLHFPTTNIINPAQGTVAMWVRPIDWSSSETAFHVFFQTLGSNGLVLYKYFENKNLLMLASRDMSSGPYFSSGLSIDWKPGEWHHIAGTWSNAGLQLYIDGKPISQAASFALLPQSLGTEFSIGDTAWSTSRTTSSLIDEVHVYDQALPPGEIKNLFLGKPVSNTSPLPPFGIGVLGGQSQDKSKIDQPSDVKNDASNPLAEPVPINASIASRINLSGNLLSVGENQIQFAQSVLPTQLTSGSTRMLTAPITAVLNQNNQRIALIASDSKINQQINSDVTIVQGRLTSGSVEILTKSTIERDGLITVTLSCATETCIPKDADLTIEIPLDTRAFEYRIRWQSGMRDLIETIKSGSNIDSTAFVPYYWLGNNDNGLFWFSDSSRNWPNALAADAIRIDRIGSTLLFRQKLKAIGQTLPPNWSYRFGLQLTPVKKPAPSAWRKLRLAPAIGANTEIIWPTPTKDSLKYYGYPEAADPARFAKRVSTIKASNRSAISYMTPSFVSTGAPEWASHQNLWMSGIFDSTSSDVRAMGGSLAAVTPTSESWKNFIANKATSFQQTYGLDGFYFDNAQVYGLYNPQLNLGYSAHGRTEKDYPIFEYRELFKRIIESLRTDNPSSEVIIHSSGHLAPPVISLADAYIDGEQYRGIVKDNYLDVLGLDQLRAEFMGRQWGLAPIFLPEFDAANAAKIEPTRGLMGLLMLHDIGIWPLWCNVAEVNRGLSALDRYDYRQTDFIPYFSATPAASSSTPNLLISSYRKSASDQLLVIANVARQTSRGRICATNRGTNSPLRFTNWRSGKVIPSDTAACIDVAINSQDYLLVRAEEQ